jgi:hypothetical protein
MLLTLERGGLISGGRERREASPFWWIVQT